MFGKGGVPPPGFPTPGPRELLPWNASAIAVSAGAAPGGISLTVPVAGKPNETINCFRATTMGEGRLFSAAAICSPSDMPAEGPFHGRTSSAIVLALQGGRQLVASLLLTGKTTMRNRRRIDLKDLPAHPNGLQHPLWLSCAYLNRLRASSIQTIRGDGRLLALDQLADAVPPVACSIAGRRPIIGDVQGVQAAMSRNQALGIAAPGAWSRPG